MLLVMEKDVTLDPVDVGLLSSDALMLHPEHVSNLVEEFGRVPDFTTETRPYPALLRMNTCWVLSGQRIARTGTEMSLRRECPARQR
jgi:hypothetical protein